MPPLLLELWREQHPLGHEQTALDFKANFPTAKSAPLFREIAPHETPSMLGEESHCLLLQPVSLNEFRNTNLDIVSHYTNRAAGL
jgi:hypothetical protein